MEPAPRSESDALGFGSPRAASGSGMEGWDRVVVVVSRRTWRGRGFPWPGRPAVPGPEELESAVLDMLDCEDGCCGGFRGGKVRESDEWGAIVRSIEKDT